MKPETRSICPLTYMHTYAHAHIHIRPMLGSIEQKRFYCHEEECPDASIQQVSETFTRLTIATTRWWRRYRESRHISHEPSPGAPLDRTGVQSDSCRFISRFVENNGVGRYFDAQDLNKGARSTVAEAEEEGKRRGGENGRGEREERGEERKKERGQQKTILSTVANVQQ
ncbi:hypothetical protein K440DRAFT_44053 [Wilcoxina mikolae CBS 423.85]|nr:hypothetical protein K440DRAFT_44053 [Wilcoxina mikolae CBS 423.85]